MTGESGIVVGARSAPMESAYHAMGVGESRAPTT